MLWRHLRSLPHPSQASYKRSRILRQRTTGVLLRPSLLVFLGVSVTTLIAIHADSLIQPPDEQPKRPDSSPTRKPLLTPFDHLFPQRTPPSPNTDEIFDLCSAAGTPEERATGISRIDSIILARYLNIVCLIFTPFSFQSTATIPAKTSLITSPSGFPVHSTTLCLGFMTGITGVV